MTSKAIEIYTPEEVAEILHVTRRTVYGWIRSGKLKASKVGRGWRVKREELDSFINGAE